MFKDGFPLTAKPLRGNTPHCSIVKDPMQVDARGGDG